MLGERGRPMLALDRHRLACSSSAIVGIIMQARADRRLRGDGLHHRQVRHRHAALARPADDRLLRHLPALRAVSCSGTIAWLAGFNILKFIRYIKEELLIVLGTSSSESVLPRMIAEAREPRLQAVGRRAGGPDRLLLQPRRHLHLPDDGGHLPRAGDQHRADPVAAARHHRRFCC